MPGDDQCCEQSREQGAGEGGSGGSVGRQQGRPHWERMLEQKTKLGGEQANLYLR